MGSGKVKVGGEVDAPWVSSSGNFREPFETSNQPCILIITMCLPKSSKHYSIISCRALPQATLASSPGVLKWDTSNTVHLRVAVRVLPAGRGIVEISSIVVAAVVVKEVAGVAHPGSGPVL